MPKSVILDANNITSMYMMWTHFIIHVSGCRTELFTNSHTLCAPWSIVHDKQELFSTFLQQGHHSSQISIWKVNYSSRPAEEVTRRWWMSGYSRPCKWHTHTVNTNTNTNRSLSCQCNLSDLLTPYAASRIHHSNLCHILHHAHLAVHNGGLDAHSL